jgi:hypothetical protein
MAPRSARPPSTPPTMPPIALVERVDLEDDEEEEEELDVEDRMVGVLDAAGGDDEAAGLVVGFTEAPGVVDVQASNCCASTGY